MYSEAELNEQLRGVSSNIPRHKKKFQTEIFAGQIRNHNAQGVYGFVPPGSHPAYAGDALKVKPNHCNGLRMKVKQMTADDLSAHQLDPRIQVLYYSDGIIQHPRQQLRRRAR